MYAATTEKAWEKRPSWWDESEKHDFLLLKKLHEGGFTNFGRDTSGFGPAAAAEGGEGEGEADEVPTTTTNKSLKELNLTKSIIQQRANQLVRELHQMDEKEETMKILADRRTKGASSNVYDKSLVDCNKKSSSSSSSSSSKKKKKGLNQTGLRSFFTATKKVSKKEKVIILSDDDENTSSSSRSSKSSDVGKRKGIATTAPEEDSPAEKKARSSIDSQQRNPVSPGRMKTFVNEDNQIELIQVEE